MGIDMKKMIYDLIGKIIIQYVKVIMIGIMGCSILIVPMFLMLFLQSFDFLEKPIQNIFNFFLSDYSFGGIKFITMVVIFTIFYESNIKYNSFFREFPFFDDKRYDEG